MKQEFKILKHFDKEHNLHTWSLQDEKWGPILSDENIDVLEEKFNNAMELCLVIRKLSKYIK